MRKKIENTETFKKIVEKNNFKRNFILNKKAMDSIERIVYQIEKLGEGYILDKNYQNREVQIAKEIIKNKENNESKN